MILRTAVMQEVSRDLFAIDARKRSTFILSKHSLFAEKQMKKSAANYRKKDFDFIIRLVVIPPLLTVAAFVPKQLFSSRFPRAHTDDSVFLFSSHS